MIVVAWNRNRKRIENWPSFSFLRSNIHDSLRRGRKVVAWYKYTFVVPFLEQLLIVKRQLT